MPVPIVSSMSTVVAAALLAGAVASEAAMPATSTALASASATRTQELPLGTWSGAMSAPGGQPIPVSFEVGRAGGSLSIVMSSVQVEGEIIFNDVRLEGDQLTFWWEPGIRVECTLTRNEAGTFEGGCSDGSGSGEGLLRMIPPAGAGG